jgi:hypothetical protein
MPGRFTALLRAHEAALTRAWVDEIYADPRTDLRRLLSYRELIDSLPEVFDELARVLDGTGNESEIAEAACCLRRHAQVRFQQGCLLDEVARELMILRSVLNDFLWREGLSVTGVDLWELRDTLRRANTLLDEMLAQTLVTYAASLRPPIRTRTMPWPPPRRRRILPDRNEEL